MNYGSVTEQLTDLPDDVEALKEMVRKYHGLTLRAEEKIRLLLRTLFGRKSEKLKGEPEDEKQGRLFDEAEASSAPAQESSAQLKTSVVRTRQSERMSPKNFGSYPPNLSWRGASARNTPARTARVPRAGDWCRRRCLPP